ncbi:MAG: hypothetical protein IJF80_01150 [Clostridia bacterium]|nr:hypothetical protein [Clostridia bacterium]
MKKIFALLLALMMVFALVACTNDETPSNIEGDDNNIGNIAEDIINNAEELDSFSEAAVEYYLKAKGISYEDLKPEWEYTVSDTGAYADDPDNGSGHAVVIFKTSDSSELTDEQIKAYYEQVFKATALASDDGYNIIGHEFVGEGENPGDETTLEKALNSFLKGWCFRKDGKNMAVYVSEIYDNNKDSALNRIFYYYGVKFDIGVGLQKSFDETLSDAENALEEYEDEIKDVLDEYIS